MKSAVSALWLTAGLGLALLATVAIGQGDPPPARPMVSSMTPSVPQTPEYVPGIEEKFPRLRYTDGQISLNDRCPVRHAKLNPKMAPVYLNGRPIGFC